MVQKQGNGPLSPVALTYLAEKIIEDIRSGKGLDGDLCKAIEGYPVVDYLRQALTTQDLDYVKRLCDSGDENEKSLGFSLLQPFVNNEKVKDFLMVRWQKTADAYEAKRLLL